MKEEICYAIILYFVGKETCVDGSCVPGTPIDCSANDLASIDQCGYIRWNFKTRISLRDIPYLQ